MSKKRIVLIILALCSLVFDLYFIAFVWQGIYSPKDPNSSQEKIFLIEKGEGTKEIADNLQKEGLIKWSPLFRIYIFKKGIAGNLQAGEYLLSPSMTAPEIAEKFVNGETVRSIITFPEGFTLSEIEEKLIENGIDAKSKIKTQKAKARKEEFKFLEDAPDYASLEGYLFPDTYQFPFKVGPEDIIVKMLNNFDQKLTPTLKAEISLQGKTIFEIVTMASLIEKEVKTPDDKKTVSGVLWKRLKIGMPLQVDATITYILGKKSTEISIDETKIDSPYNTYKYKGLPLGPICNPGIESIIAAIYPGNNEYWFYLSTPEGKTIFSKTLQEHNIAKEKYLR